MVFCSIELNVALLLSASPEIHHLTWAGWGEKHGLQTPPISLQFMEISVLSGTGVFLLVTFLLKMSNVLPGSPASTGQPGALLGTWWLTAFTGWELYLHFEMMPCDLKAHTAVTQTCPGAHVGSGSWPGRWKHH